MREGQWERESKSTVKRERQENTALVDALPHSLVLLSCINSDNDLARPLTDAMTRRWARVSEDGKARGKSPEHDTKMSASFTGSPSLP